MQVAQYLGAGKNKLARQVVCQSILFNIIFGLCMALIVVGASFYLPTLLGADPSICRDATLYLAIVGAFIPFNMMAMLHSGMLRCSGNAVLPSLMNISMCVFDVLFNYFFYLYIEFRSCRSRTWYGNGAVGCRFYFNVYSSQKRKVRYVF